MCVARNRGLLASQGELIAYLDSDNVWVPDYLLFMVAMFAQNYKLEAAYAAMKVFNRDLGRKYIFAQPYDRRKLLTANFIDLNVFMHRRTLYEEYGGFNETLDRLVDWELIIRYTRQVSAPLIPFVGVLYYIDKIRLGNISTTKNYNENRDKIYQFHNKERQQMRLGLSDV